jgi:Thioredoxin-like
MKLCRPTFPFVLLLFFFSASGQTLFITGSGSGYKNAELRFYSQTDPITKRLKPLLNVTCNEKGSFSCSVPYEKNELIFIKAGIYNLNLYVTDSTRYEILMPDWIARPVSEEQNPFFIETELIPEVVSNKQDVNNLIRAFDYDYNPVFNFVADRVFKNYKKEEINRAISKLDKYSEVREPSFYDDYIKCRMMLLHLVGSSSSQDLDKATEFINSGFKSGNQAFFDLAEQMYSGYFNKLSSGQLKEAFNLAVATASFTELRSVVLHDVRITNKELVDFIILLNLSADYFNRNLPGENVRKIISLMKSEGTTIFIKNIAASVLGEIDNSLPGNTPPDFLLVNTDDKLMCLKDFRGKYLVLGFGRSDDQVSLMEMGIIKMWQQKYINDVQVVTILTDKDFKFSSQSLKNRGFKWIFLDGSKKEKLEFDYNIKMYPSFILIDRVGKIIADPCPYPSEGLELTISKILQADPTRSGPENR